MVCGDIAALNTGEGKLSLIMNDKGGIMDDCVITSYDDHVYVFKYSGCFFTHETDMAILSRSGGDMRFRFLVFIVCCSPLSRTPSHPHPSSHA